MGWTRDSYTQFAVGPQLLGLWDLAHYFRALAICNGVALGPRCLTLDYGAGPMVLSRLFSSISESQITAAVQDPFRLFVEAVPPLPSWINSARVCARAIGDQFFEASEQFDFIFSYACFHEFSQPATVLKHLYQLLKPGGLAVIVDTLRDASDKVNEKLAESTLGEDARKSIWETFHLSLGLDDVSSLISAAPFQISVESLAIPQDVYLESRLSWQGEEPSGELDDVGGSCYRLMFQRAN
jgi:SAM-dependent methyltransferase